MQAHQILSCILESGLQILIFCSSHSPALRAKKRLLPLDFYPEKETVREIKVENSPSGSGLWGGLASNYNATLYFLAP